MPYRVRIHDTVATLGELNFPDETDQATLHEISRIVLSEYVSRKARDQIEVSPLLGCLVEVVPYHSADSSLHKT